MPVAQPPPPPAPGQERRSTFGRRFAISAVRFAIVMAIAALISGGWYLAKKGFVRQWRHLIVEELHKHGVEASIGHLTLDPFRGLVAQDVRIFDYKNHANTLALISEISLDINYAAFFHHEPFLNALDVRNADLRFPIRSASEKIQDVELKKCRAHIYFPPEQIYVSQAEGFFCGLKISATGQLIKRSDYKPSEEISDEEWRQRLLLVHRVADELRRFTFPGEAPALQVKFAGDLSQFESVHAEATLTADRLRRGDYEMANLSLAAEWANQTLQINQCGWTDNAGNFSGRATWSRETGAADFQGRRTLDAKRFLEAVGFPQLLADVTLTSPPLLELSGAANFAGDKPKLSVIGRLAVERFSYKAVPLLNLTA